MGERRSKAWILDTWRESRYVLQQLVDQPVKTPFESLIQQEEDDQIELTKIKAVDYF